MEQEKKKIAAELQLLSDQDFPYALHESCRLIHAYDITSSMSGKGNCYDHAWNPRS